MEDKQNYIYFDHNATTAVRPEVCSKILQISQFPYNPSAIHSLGREAKILINKERSFIANHIGCEEDELFFTSGGTESNNIVLQSQQWDQVLCSATEHDSVYKGPIHHTIPVLSSGCIDIEALEKLLQDNCSEKTLVSIHWANNETGVIQPIKEIAEIVHRYEAKIHVDAVQILGKIPFSFKDVRVDFMSLSGHKIGGPQGIGVLVSRKGGSLSPLFFGGGQEKFLRPGTENIAGIIGLAEAIRCINFEVFNNLKVQHARLEKELKNFSEEYKKPTKIIGEESLRLPNTTCLTMPGVSNQSQLIYFDLKKIGVSIGSACSSSTVKPSRVLQNMGFSEEVTGAAIRVSSGWNTLEADFERFKEAWKALFLKHHDSI